MREFNQDNRTGSYHGCQKILLALLPYWTPMIPALGIASLKSFLQRHGYEIKAIDATVEEEFKEIYNQYFDLLKVNVPENKRGNFFNVGNDVLQNHMMAHMNYEDEKHYIELVKIIIYKIYYVAIKEGVILELAEILDKFFTRLKRYFLNLLQKEKPDVVGLTVHNHTLPASLFVFRITKEKYPHIKTVMGGGIFTESLAVGSPNLAYFVEKTPYIDNIIIGEGENLFLKLLKGEFQEPKKVYTREDIQWETIDINEIDLPDLSDLDLDKYPCQGISCSRSCPYQCAFCSDPVYFGKYQIRDIGKSVADMIKMYQNQNNQLFHMTDSLLNPIITELSEGLINSGISLYWDGYLRVSESLCNIENTLVWRRGGFYRVRLGIESGSQRVLDLMNKKITVEQIRAALFSLAYAGIKTTTYWVVGYPGETEEDFQHTLDLLEELKDNIWEAWCHPFQYSYYGLVKSDRWRKDAVLLYPEEAREMLITQTWIVDCEPNREEIYRRLNRFVQHCNKLGIPNPHFMSDVFKADERWEKLHKNAVPKMVEFSDKVYIDENKNVSAVSRSRRQQEDSGDFVF
ncbi:MAG: radical SAM protein [Candidatus Aminicenantes bacterium]|nr:radical SAM protein [Candidatus Aminicenantes bacterium]NIM83446.1 radical SAM protein [Candidatus Aminicenantes bacterium]NIN22838.1 radical SAM protein [Candidatus Aminicenantes bacterium]NIN46574.1 radical SAM protein [Candidatus Aminicenantes bacterium]NIN89477.1 radical SAM protein [Candidatus Aminicenantes bacterium]